MQHQHYSFATFPSVKSVIKEEVHLSREGFTCNTEDTILSKIPVLEVNWSTLYREMHLVGMQHVNRALSHMASCLSQLCKHQYNRNRSSVTKTAQSEERMQHVAIKKGVTGKRSCRLVYGLGLEMLQYFSVFVCSVVRLLSSIASLSCTICSCSDTLVHNHCCCSDSFLAGMFGLLQLR